MSDYNTDPTLSGLIRKALGRISTLEKTNWRPRKFATADRPAASTVQGEVIFNTTTLKHEGSDGTNWNALY